MPSEAVWKNFLSRIRKCVSKYQFRSSVVVTASGTAPKSVLATRDGGAVSRIGKIEEIGEQKSKSNSVVAGSL